MSKHKTSSAPAPEQLGILPDDPRLNTSEFLERIRSGSWVVPNFDGFIADLLRIFEATQTVTSGKVASYIPQLAQVNPELWGMAVCTVDGQRWSTGDAQHLFSLQSVAKPLNYCMALEELGRDEVHKRIGREPSGHTFNAITLDNSQRPHNPMINAGAIVSLSLFSRSLPPEERLRLIQNTWARMGKGTRPTVNEAIFKSEKITADRNYALGYFMREKGVFPAGTDLHMILDLYFQCCALELSCEDLAVVAATLASGGRNPLSGERVLKVETVKDCLSLMHSCGMYDFSGEFAFLIGLPAKSGVSGGLMVVVPNLLGLALYSPRVDAHGNSVRGVEFCKRMVDEFSFHQYDSLVEDADRGRPRKKDPRRNV